jgi:cell shape-determining protein MreC
MNYLLRSSKPQKSLKGKFFFFLTVIILIFLFLTSPGKNVLKILAMPFWKVSSSIKNSFINNIKLLESKRSLIEANEVLSEEILMKDKDLRFASILKSENEELKKISQNNKFKNIIISSIISRPTKTPYDTLIIDSGSQSGIKIGDLVLIDGNVFIGTIYEVSDYFSKVRLYSSPGEKTDVLIGESKIQKEAFGIGSGNFKVEFPKDQEVKEGDSVVIPSINSNIFGVVEKIEQKSVDSFKTVLFKSPINIQEIRFVEVLIKK